MVFGATGDLTLRKLLPALYYRFRDGQMPPDSHVIAAARSDLDDEAYRKRASKALREHVAREDLDTDTADRFCRRVSYVRLDATDANADWHVLANVLDADRVRVFYLATSPDLYGPICRNIGEHGLVTEQSRVVLEKPIGHDLASAREINDEVGAVFSEAQTFRIDHYLGKETVQNLLALRFANTIFERLWNVDVIDHVQITVAETVGVEGRGGYYDRSGALRDMVQNHMLQLLCLVAMEPPVSLEADRVRDEKLKVLRALRPFEPHEAPTLDGARSVHPGCDRRPAGARLHRRPQRFRKQPDRDLRRAEGRRCAPGAGRTCRSTCAPASACRRRCQRSSSSIAPCPSRSSPPTPPNGRRTS